MPDFRKVYFSFHYEDVTLAAQIRKCDVCFDEKKKQSFGDWADWESIKKASPAQIKRWIRDQMKGASVTVVLIGSETATREWVKFEIEESVKNNIGLVGIHLNNMIGFLQRHQFARIAGAN